MTDATNPKKGEGAEGASPEAIKPEPEEPTTVPLKVASKLRADKRELKDEVEELRAELARLKEQKPQPAASASDDVQKALEEIKQFRAEQQRRGLADQLGLDPKQTDAVAALLREMPNLNPQEALTLATLRDGKLFESRGQAGFDPSQHGSLRPTPGAQPGPAPKKTLKDHVARIAELQKTDRVAADSAFNELMESQLFKACGYEHPLNK